MKADLSSYSRSGPREGPTERQASVLRFIASFSAEHGYPPTLREIGDELGMLSTNGAATHIDRLVRKGMVTRKALVARGLVLTDAGRAFLEAQPGPAPACAEGGS